MEEIKILSLNNIENHFPSHFHEFYVIGFIKKGNRKMHCNDTEYILNPGDAVIFNPYDIHSCKNLSNDLMEYQSLNIETKFMENLFRNNIPRFQNFIKASDLPDIFCETGVISNDKTHLAKILKQLPYSLENNCKNHTLEIEKICKIIEQNISNKISLEFLCNLTGLSKSSLLRIFVQQKKITPYRYIENVRINMAKTLLLKGMRPVDVAFKTGFSSQSHFSNSFKSLFGLAPIKYQKGIKRAE